MASEAVPGVPVPVPVPGPVEPPTPPCDYPQSNPTAHDIVTELNSVTAQAAACTSFYLDTLQSMSNSDIADIFSSEGEDHAQGLARTHQLSDGSVYWFLSYSNVGTGNQGTLSQYRYGGPCDGAHVLQTSPYTVAPMIDGLFAVDDQHPSDIVFLPDVNGADAGYLFVTEEYDQHQVAVYRWSPGEQLQPQGTIRQPYTGHGPNFLFLDLIGDRYCLGVASNTAGTGYLYWADPARLFPGGAVGMMDVSAFEPDPDNFPFPFPIPATDSPCQTKLVRDQTGSWFLLAFRSNPDSAETGGEDWVDVYPVAFSPFSILDPITSVHIIFNPGDTSFASTGTHYVEPSGRLLISSSYRWAEDEGPGDSSFVSRVDECPSWVPTVADPGGGGGGLPIDGPPHHQL